ncbi:2,4-diaminobutyrate 4-transaminase [Catenulispora acidiphila DSM 44928]|uniref:Diaminobutyrate--2-oxoglutarate transaminase n=1 Tax=Catenulispora acidiphila (strain DSM 44928 / JCM 14897 / NBRC 102108 / NRRL B-24433 / ID139908) TaxID=479433 RepID=C7QD17_CATAD|nr:diaminobutyrate--2-oxoglutarate transaminase family protein [Catenulispora acidiphila]ACU70727.1 2,4-diaminobutyrate 4-transaminase [Catenulispora acidiphila DSM 44928]
MPSPAAPPAVPSTSPAAAPGDDGPTGPARPAPAAKILARQAARESAARTYARHLPIVPVRAQGSWITGADGRDYLDCLSGAGTLALGHNHPAVLAAIREVLDSGAPLHVLDLATPVKDDFTSALLEALPPELAADCRVHFAGPTGADAVEAAVKLARTATGRRGVFAFTGAYHGMTAGALALTGANAVREPAVAGDAFLTRLPFPHPYRCPFGLGGALGEGASAAYVRTLLSDPHSGTAVPAAVVVEPVQGEGGVVPAPDGWLRALRATTAEHGVPLIADEVQTGFGRTGTLFGVDHAGVVPDVMVLSKAVGGGLPLAVVVYRAELDRWSEGAHTGTFRGNQLAMAAGAATIRHILAENLAARAAELGERLTTRLTRYQARHPLLGQIRGRGLMLGMEIVDPHATPDALGALPAAPLTARRLRAELLSRGVIAELGGRHAAVLRLLPPLTLADDEADHLMTTLHQALDAVADHTTTRNLEAAGV